MDNEKPGVMNEKIVKGEKTSLKACTDKNGYDAYSLDIRCTLCGSWNMKVRTNTVLEFSRGQARVSHLIIDPNDRAGCEECGNVSSVKKAHWAATAREDVVRVMVYSIHVRNKNGYLIPAGCRVIRLDCMAEDEKTGVLTPQYGGPVDEPVKNALRSMYPWLKRKDKDLVIDCGFTRPCPDPNCVDIMTGSLGIGLYTSKWSVSDLPVLATLAQLENCVEYLADTALPQAPSCFNR